MQVYSDQVSCPKYIIKINFYKKVYQDAFLTGENDAKMSIPIAEKHG